MKAMHASAAAYDEVRQQVRETIDDPNNIQNDDLGLCL
jgi:hypothetical protein